MSIACVSISQQNECKKIFSNFLLLQTISSFCRNQQPTKIDFHAFFSIMSETTDHENRGTINKKSLRNYGVYGTFIISNHVQQIARKDHILRRIYYFTGLSLVASNFKQILVKMACKIRLLYAMQYLKRQFSWSKIK